jgi:peptidoglycan hydrolase CwlO-like protein
MADLNTSLNDLQGAVSNAVTALQTSNQPLKDALAAAQQQVADLTVDDQAQKDALAQSLADAQAAADNIETQVSALNAAAGAAPTA